MFYASPERLLSLSDSPSLLFNEWWGFFHRRVVLNTYNSTGCIWNIWTAFSSKFRRPKQGTSSFQYISHQFSKYSPHVRLTSVSGDTKNGTAVMSIWKWRDASPTHFFTLVSLFASAPGLWNGTIVRDRTCPRVPLLRGRTFWAFIVNCTVINCGLWY